MHDKEGGPVNRGCGALLCCATSRAHPYHAAIQSTFSVAGHVNGTHREPSSRSPTMMRGCVLPPFFLPWGGVCRVLPDCHAYLMTPIPSPPDTRPPREKERGDGALH